VSHNPAFDLNCSRCPVHAPRERVALEVYRDPPGWTHLSMTGLPVRNWLLCPSCAAAVRRLLDTPPAPAAPPSISERAAAALADLVLADAEARGDERHPLLDASGGGVVGSVAT
jgi:hypothetical protein